MSSPIPLAVEKLRDRFGLQSSQLLRTDLAKDGSVWVEAEAEGQPLWFHAGKSLETLKPAEDHRLPLCSQHDFDAPHQRVISWRPGRRIAIHVDLQDGFEVLKGLRPKKLAAAHLAYHLVHSTLVSKEDFLTPAVEALDQSSSLRLQGLELGAISFARAAAADYERVGRCLNRFQRAVPCQALTVHKSQDELGILDDLSQRHQLGMGSLPRGWSRLRQRLEAANPGDDLGAVASHRDLHDGQILASADRVGLLDFDLLACASPMLDVGNLGAHLYLRELQLSQTQSGTARACEAALWSGLGLDRSHAELRFYRAATFLRLALVYSLRPKWHPLIPSLLKLANQSLDELNAS